MQLLEKADFEQVRVAGVTPNSARFIQSEERNAMKRNTRVDSEAQRGRLSEVRSGPD